MINVNRATTPEIHASAQRLAFRFVGIIEAVLTSEERSIALQAAYEAARAELEAVLQGGVH